MKTIRYYGVFISSDGDIHRMETSCNGFLQAFFLLTADAIREGKHYQLYSITDEKGDARIISDIIKCSELIN